MAEAAATWRYTTAMTVPTLAEEMLDPAWRGADRPLIQFIMDWRRFPDQREQMLAERYQRHLAEITVHQPRQLRRPRHPPVIMTPTGASNPQSSQAGQLCTLPPVSAPPATDAS